MSELVALETQAPKAGYAMDDTRANVDPKPQLESDLYRAAGKLDGKAALVTGGDSGIGAAVAIAFAKEGADVAIAYYSSDDDAQAVAERIRPGCIIAVDALASRSLKRVCRTVQLSDTGISPGSGVGNHRHALDRSTLGVPVLAVGVPTVVDAATLAADVLSEAGGADLDPEALSGAGEGLIVTPKDIDAQMTDLSKVLGYAITLALQPHLTLEDAELLLS